MPTHMKRVGEVNNIISYKFKRPRKESLHQSVINHMIVKTALNTAISSECVYILTVLTYLYL